MTAETTNRTAIRVLCAGAAPETTGRVGEILARAGGFQVTAARSRGEFESLLGQGAWDLVLSDLEPFGPPPFAVLEAVWRRPHAPPVLILTANRAVEVAVEAMKRGAADYVLATPDQLESLPGRIRALVAGTDEVGQMPQAGAAQAGGFSEGPGRPGSQARAGWIEHHRRRTARAVAERDRALEGLVTKTRLAAVGQLSANIAHELRNPLGAIRNAAYYLKRQLAGQDPQIATFSDMIDEEVGRADRIITNLLGMARAREPRKRDVNLNQTVEQVWQDCHARGEVDCRLQTDADPFFVWADPDQLRQLVANLLDNALEALDGKGQVVVEAIRGTGYDTLVFQDTGPGVAPAMRAHLFDVLASDKAHGTGLGLSICRRIVEGHGGTIELLESAGTGAAFRIRLPREDCDLSTTG